MSQKQSKPNPDGDILPQQYPKSYDEATVEELQSAEDSESSSQQPELTAADRAAHLADGLLYRPLTDDQALELAKVYALLAIAEQLGSRPGTSELISALTVNNPGA